MLLIQSQRPLFQGRALCIYLLVPSDRRRSELLKLKRIQVDSVILFRIYYYANRIIRFDCREQMDGLWDPYPVTFVVAYACHLSAAACAEDRNFLSPVGKD